MNDDTIVALTTPSGMGAIAMLRLSGTDAFSICDSVFLHSKNKKISHQQSHTLLYGSIMEDEMLIDDVLVSVFRNPHSFTGEDSVEISCHGSVFIQQQLLQLFIKKGARLAKPGEFTMRAFFNGKMDLSQAEAVADLVSSNSEASHKVAMQQMRGKFSDEIKTMRAQLIDFASLIELELDFSEEDVEFANRDDLKALVSKIQVMIKRLLDSFALGNVIKNGIPIAIAGEPNVGKSTLLNALLNEERAIVSEIAGTTRDTIEEEIVIEGLLFRFTDTAGIRETTDIIETMGIKKTFEKLNQSSLIIYLFDALTTNPEELSRNIAATRANITEPEKRLLAVANKIDLGDEEKIRKDFSAIEDIIFISAKEGKNIELLRGRLLELVNTGALKNNETIVTNTRHFEALSKALEALNHVYEGLNNNITGDFLAIDIRRALHFIGSITGEITNKDLLKNIFGKFCIGK